MVWLGLIGAGLNIFLAMVVLPLSKDLSWLFVLSGACFAVGAWARWVQEEKE